MATVKAKANPKKGVLAKFKSKAAKGKATTAKATASKAKTTKAKTAPKSKAAAKAKTVKAKVAKAKAMKAKTTKAKVVKAKAKVVKAAAKPKAVAKPKDIATEIEKSGNPAMLRAAIKRLNASGKPRKELLVPGIDMDRAKKIAKEIVKGKMTIQNLGRTQRKFVR